MSYGTNIVVVFVSGGVEFESSLPVQSLMLIASGYRLEGAIGGRLQTRIDLLGHVPCSGFARKLQQVRPFDVSARLHSLFHESA